MKLNKNACRGIAVLAICLIVFLVISFVCPFVKNSVFVLSLIFGVFAIVVAGAGTYLAFKNGEGAKSKFYGFPIAKLAILYGIGQIVLSLMFMAAAKVVPVWIPVVIDIILLAAACIGMIAADAVRDEIIRQDIKQETDTSCLTTLRSLVYPLAGRCDDVNAKKALEKLADEFRYSDPVSSDALKTIEIELETAVAKLQEVVSAGDAEQITGECKRVSELLTERNRLCKLNKRATG